MNNYYIESGWDKSWIAAPDEMVRLLTEININPIEISDKCITYKFDYAGTDYSIFKSSQEYAAYRNRIISVNYEVFVVVNGRMMPARPHQKEALILFIVTGNPYVEVPHKDGGVFKVTFSQISQDKFKYTTEYGTTVELVRKVTL